MLANKNKRHQSDWSICFCTHHPSFFQRPSWLKRVQTVWPQWLYKPQSQLRINLSSLIGPCDWSEHCATISLVNISSWITQTMILDYELSDQEALTSHQVKAHHFRVLAASKVFQSGVFLRTNPISLPLEVTLTPSHSSI